MLNFNFQTMQSKYKTKYDHPNKHWLPTWGSLPSNTGDVRDMGSIPGSGRSPGEGHGNSLQYSCLENLKDRGAWWATVHGVTKSWP